MVTTPLLLCTLLAFASCGPHVQAHDRAPLWSVDASVSGGIDGRTQKVTVAADGALTVSVLRGRPPCSTRLDAATLQRLEESIRATRPDAWRASYVNHSNPNGCCDQLQTAITLHRQREDGGPSDFKSSWFSETAKDVPADLSALFEAVWKLSRACPAK